MPCVAPPLACKLQAVFGPFVQCPDGAADKSNHFYGGKAEEGDLGDYSDTSNLSIRLRQDTLAGSNNAASNSGDFESYDDSEAAEALANGGNGHHGGGIEEAVREAILREALFTQRKAGIDDTVRNAEELLRISSEPSLWPSPTDKQQIVGDSKAIVATTTSAAEGDGKGEGGSKKGAAVAESELSAAIRALAPKPHLWSELYVADMDLLAYQIKNAIASSFSPSALIASPSSSPAAVDGDGDGCSESSPMMLSPASAAPSMGASPHRSAPFASLNRMDMLTVWYLSLTREELRIMRFAKKLLASARCLAAVNVHLCVKKASIPALAPIYRRTVDDFESLRGGGEGAVVRTSSLGLGAVLTSNDECSSTSHENINNATVVWVSLLDLFPSKLTKIEEVKSLLAVGARLSELVADCYRSSHTAEGGAAGTFTSIDSSARGGETVCNNEGDDAGSEWSIGFEEEVAMGSNTASVPAAREEELPATYRALSDHFALQLRVVHDSSVYVDAARAVLRSDPREKC